MPPASEQTAESLYRDHHDWVRTLLRQRSGCSETAADLAQDTFVRLLAREADLRLIREPRAYLRRIAQGLLANHWRRRDIEQAYAEALRSQPQALASSPEEHHVIVETLCRIDALLSGLPRKVRRAFLLSRCEGERYAEIARTLGVSERMVKKYIAQAMLHCLQSEHDEGA